MIGRIFKAVILAIVSILLMVNTVLAAWEYLFPITIIDTSGSARTYYPVMLGFGGQTLVDASKISANGTDTNMQVGSTSIKYMLSTTNAVAVIPSLPTGGVVTTNLYTGYTPLQSGFPIITGSGGYVTVSDNANLEMGFNFTMKQKGWVDTSNGSSKNIVFKSNAFRAYVSGEGNITASILSNATSDQTLRPSGVGDETGIANTYNATSHWEAVSDNTDTAWVYTANTTYEKDLYALANSSNTTFINSIAFYFRIRCNGVDSVNATPHFKISGTTYNGTEQSQVGAVWATKNETFVVSPASSVAWTWSEVNAMQIGISIKTSNVASNAACSDIRIDINFNDDTEVTSLITTGISSANHTVEITTQTPSVTEEFYTSQDSDEFIVTNGWKAQTFNTTSQYIVGQVRIWGRGIGNGGGTITVSIRATVAGLPSGADLTSGTIAASSFPSSNGLVSVNVTPLLLSNATQYAIVIGNSGGDLANYVMWRADATAPAYGGGTYCSSGDFGGTWASDAGKDFYFVVRSCPFALYVDDALGAFVDAVVTVPDSSTPWLLMQNDVMPYADNISLSVNGTQQLYLAPLVMLTGVTVPDRAGNDNPGTITWGSNSGISITYGEMESYESYIASTNATGGFDMPTSPIPSTWFVGGENASALPFYDSFSSVATQTGKPVQVYYFLAIMGVAFGAFLGIVTFTHSALMAYIAMVVIFMIGASMTIVPSWIVFAMIVVGAGIMYLYRQVA